MTSKPSRIRLSCGDEVWLRAPLPVNGEAFYCVRCEEAVTVGAPVPLHGGVTIYPDYEWTCAKHPSGTFVGVCIANDNGCGHRAIDSNWYKVEEAMRKHFLREHAASTLVAQFTETPIPEPLPRGSAAPF